MVKGPFVPLSVSYRENDKVLGVEPLAELLFVRALAFAKEKFTDGFVGRRQAMILAGDLADAYSTDRESLCRQLVDVGLWVPVDGGWLIDGWTDWNALDASRAGTFGNHKRWHVGRGLVDAECIHCAASSGEHRPESGAMTPDIAPESGQPSGLSQDRTETETEQTRAALPARELGFAEFWSVYPRRRGRKVGKERALERWSALDLASRRLAFKAAKRYAAACDAGETIAKDPERFLTRNWWRDWLEDAEPCAPPRPSHVPPDAVPDGNGGWVRAGVAS